MSYFLAFIGAAVVGICVALEPTVNSGLGKFISPRLATLHSFLTGTLVIILINAFLGGIKEYRNIIKAPPYLWIGGFVGATVVYLGARVAIVLGIASTLTIMVAVQIITGIFIDTFGFFGVTKVPIDLNRIIGIVILIIAVKLIVR